MAKDGVQIEGVRRVRLDLVYGANAPLLAQGLGFWMPSD